MRWVAGIAMILTAVSGGRAEVATALPTVPGAGDRVLFLGDDLTQQMFYSRAVAACLLSLQPGGDLRVFNAGWEGATAGDAVAWSEPLIHRTRATVVVVCFGLADAVTRDHEQYELELSNLVASVKRSPRVRAVIVMSPPALPKQTGRKLREFAEIAERVAKTEGTVFVDIYRPMRRLYDRADDALMRELTLGDRLPGEAMHVVIASHVLEAMGVTGAMASSVAWSPLPPVRMGAVREHLAWGSEGSADAPTLERAAASRRVYLALTACDELFFRWWRLDEGEAATRRQAEWSQAWAAAAALATAVSPDTD